MSADQAHNPKMQYLIDHLQSQLSASPVTHPLTITVIESRSKATTALFPYAEDPPKVRVQQVLVTVSADVTQGNEDSISGAEGKTKEDESNFDVSTQAQSGHDAPENAAKNPDRILLCALEAYIYHVPSTSSCLVYISKVDSTGYSPAPDVQTPVEPPTAEPSKRARLPPTTYFLVKAFLSFYHPVSPSQTHRIQRPHNHKHLYVNLFARSANQYLFPNSILGGKKVLGGVKLCKWWKRLFEDVIMDLQMENGVADGPAYHSYLTYFLPSYDHLEARSLVGISPPATAQPPVSDQPLGAIDWKYLPPGDPSLNSLLFPPGSTSKVTDAEIERKSRLIAMLVPVFDDDPKARFLVELVINNPVGKMRVGKAKRQGPHPESGDDNQRKRQRLEGNAERDDPLHSSGSVPVDTHSNDGVSSSSTIKDIQEKRRNDERRLRQEDAATLATTSWDNFWTRMGYRQECISGDVTGFFSMYVGLPSATDTPAEPSTKIAQEDDKQLSTEEGPYQVSHPLLSRIAAALLNHDFANRTLAIEATRRFLDQTENIVVAEIGKDLWQRRCIGRVESNEKGKAFQASSSGSTLAVQPAVNVLQVKKKKRPTK